jgi:hypothetical protein
MRTNVLYLLLVVITLFSCEKEGGTGTKTLGAALLTDAKTLFLGSQTSNKKSSGDESPGNEKLTMYKVTNEGVIKEVTIKDKDGNDVTSQLYPTAIHSINSEHIMVVFRKEELTEQSIGFETYIANINTGSLYYIENVYPAGSNDDWLIQIDGNNNCYFFNHSGYLVKINLIDYTCTELVDNVDRSSGSGFVLNKAGVLGYNGKLRFADGGFHYLEDMFMDMRFANGLDDDFLYNSEYTDDNEMRRSCVVSISVEGKSIAKTVVDSFSMIDIGQYFKIQQSGKLLFGGLHGFAVYDHNSEDRLRQFFYVGFSDPSNLDYDPVTGRIYDIHAPGQLMYYLDEIHFVKTVIVNNKYAYMVVKNQSNQPGLLKVIFGQENVSVEQIIPYNQYDIYNISANDDDELMIYAMRMSDGMDILAQISANNDVTVLQENQNKVYSLTPVTSGK